MEWKNWSYWLRGGAIGLLIVILIFLVGVVFLPVQCIGLSQDGSSCRPVQGADAFVHNVKSILNIEGVLYYVLAIIILSCLIGWIVGKIKKK